MSVGLAMGTLLQPINNSNRAFRCVVGYAGIMKSEPLVSPDPHDETSRSPNSPKSPFLPDVFVEGVSGYATFPTLLPGGMKANPFTSAEDLTAFLKCFSSGKVVPDVSQYMYLLDSSQKDRAEFAANVINRPPELLPYCGIPLYTGCDDHERRHAVVGALQRIVRLQQLEEASQLLSQEPPRYSMRFKFAPEIQDCSPLPPPTLSHLDSNIVSDDERNLHVMDSALITQLRAATKYVLTVPLEMIPFAEGLKYVPLGFPDPVSRRREARRQMRLLETQRRRQQQVLQWHSREVLPMAVTCSDEARYWPLVTLDGTLEPSDEEELMRQLVQFSKSTPLYSPKLKSSKIRKHQSCQHSPLAIIVSPSVARMSVSPEASPNASSPSASSQSRLITTTLNDTVSPRRLETKVATPGMINTPSPVLYQPPQSSRELQPMAGLSDLSSKELPLVHFLPVMSLKQIVLSDRGPARNWPHSGNDTSPQIFMRLRDVLLDDLQDLNLLLQSSQASSTPLLPQPSASLSQLREMEQAQLLDALASASARLHSHSGTATRNASTKCKTPPQFDCLLSLCQENSRVKPVNPEALLGRQSCHSKSPHTPSPQPSGMAQKREKPIAFVVVENDIPLALFRFGDTVLVSNSQCPHAGGPLEIGDIENLPDGDCLIRCPWHSYRFNLFRDGEIVHPKSRSDLRLKMYPVRVDETGAIYVGFDKFCEQWFSTF